MKKIIRYAIFIGLPLLVLLIVAKKQGWLGADEGVSVEVSEVEKVNLTETVIASGKIQPEVEVQISPEVSGEIIALPVKEGSAVKKGDLLVKINPDLFLAAVNRSRAAVNSARAALASAKAQLIEAERNFNRNKGLWEKKVISDAEYDAFKRAYEVAKLGVESAEYQRESAQATLTEAQDNLQRTTIYAPQDGTISLLNSEVGERVVGTAQMAGTEIMRVADLQNMEVLVEVNENDIIRVNRGDTARIEVDAYLGTVFNGTVTEIANSANLDGLSVDQVTNFQVKVRILPSSYAELLKPGEQSPFRPGMTASVSIETERRNQVLAVPIQAVTTRTDTTGKTGYQAARQNDGEEQVFEVVFVYQDGTAELRTVKTGIQDEEYIQIEEGLSEGDRVITGPYSLVSRSLASGDAVRAKDETIAKEEE